MACKVTDCYSKGSATATAGDAAGFVEQIASTGEAENCYSTGAVSGSAAAAGFCDTNNGTITACFWDTETSGVSEGDNGTGLTTSEMKQKATFAAWSSVIWGLFPNCNNGYPCLKDVTPSCSAKGNVAHPAHPAFPDHPGLGGVPLSASLGEILGGSIPIVLPWRRPPVSRIILGIQTTPVAGDIILDGQNLGKYTTQIKVTVPSGSHRIEFGPVAGYTTPAPILVYLDTNRDVVGTYVITKVAPPPVTPPPVTPSVGTILIQALYGGNLVNGAVIYVDGIDIGVGSARWTGNIGSHQVRFGTVPGLTAPPTEWVVIVQGENPVMNRWYTALAPAPAPAVGNGWIRVNITFEPWPGVNSAGVPRVAPGMVYLDGVWQNLPFMSIYHGWYIELWAKTGTHTVSFQPVSGFATPASQTVVVPDGKLVTISVRFQG